jgi:hypothetical protein
MLLPLLRAMALGRLGDAGVEPHAQHDGPRAANLSRSSAFPSLASLNRVNRR